MKIHAFPIKNIIFVDKCNVSPDIISPGKRHDSHIILIYLKSSDVYD